MDTRKVQRTSDMFYLYLPTKWCKQYGIDGSSKVGISYNPDGSMSIHPQARAGKPIHLTLKTDGSTIASLHKLIIACYISPAESFKIRLGEEMDLSEVLSQKNMMSLELVEIEGDAITCESSVQISSPAQLLLTMIRKIKNLLVILGKKGHSGLIERYEEEIDRSRLLIEKGVITSLVKPAQAQLRAIELHFIAVISKELERMADHLITLEVPPQSLLKRMGGILSELIRLLDNQAKDLRVDDALAFLDMVDSLQGIKVKDVTSYAQRRSVRSLNSISEVIIDWAVIREIERSTI